MYSTTRNTFEKLLQQHAVLIKMSRNVSFDDDDRQMMVLSKLQVHAVNNKNNHNVPVERW